jgi:hypothetical protein
VIDQRGEMHQMQAYWQEAAFKDDIHLNNSRTMFSYTGDLFGKAACFLSLWLIVWPYLNRLRSRRKSA